MEINHRDILSLFGTSAEIARFLGIKPPSVHGWTNADGQVVIPEHRLMQLAPEIEMRSNRRITRKDLFPDCWRKYWPELDSQECCASHGSTVPATGALHHANGTSNVSGSEA